MNPIYEAAIAYRAAGLAVIPSHRIEKRPLLASWQDYQRRLPTLRELATWQGRFAHGGALSILAGAVSGGLEVIDFDAPELYPAWQAQVAAAQADLLPRLPVVQTQHGGFHVYYRSEVVTRNHKLAVDHTRPDGKYTLIETRGGGGCVLAPPSPGYTLLAGALTQLPTLSAAERELLIAAARSLTRVPEPVVRQTQIEPARQVPNGALRPGDDYNRRGDVIKLLEAHGWVLVGEAGDTLYWRRPGKHEGISATYRSSTRGFYCFSTNVPELEPERSYTPFGLYAALEHGGDFAAASRTLRQAGYGDVRR